MAHVLVIKDKRAILRDVNKTSVRGQVKTIMEQAWSVPGFCVPNLEVYPHQWLWDSCFHAIIWAELGDARAIVELETSLANQTASGFVPHMNYWSEPNVAADFWGRSGVSSITQPPMYGHAAAEVERRGFTVPEALIRRIEHGFCHLLDRKLTDAHMVPIFHPWESGCDDSPRWDPTIKGSKGFDFDPKSWKAVKGDLVKSLVLDEAGVPQDNPNFVVGSIGFNSLIVFNFEEFFSIPRVADRPKSKALSGLVAALKRAIRDRWDTKSGTWVDDGNSTDLGWSRNFGCRTADALLGLLVDDKEEAFDQVIDQQQFYGKFGLLGVHRSERSFNPDIYWRGPCWPQLTYLIIVAASRHGKPAVAAKLRNSLQKGAVASGMAEYWNPDTGAGLGAVPQTWAGLSLIDP